MGLKDWLLVFTTVAAVVGPFITTRLNNKHAMDLLGAQQNHESRRFMLEKKYALYDEALALFGSHMYATLHPSEAGATQRDSAAMATRLAMFGSEDLMVQAIDTHHKILDFEMERASLSKSVQEGAMSMEAFRKALTPLKDAADLSLARLIAMIHVDVKEQ